MANSSVTSIGRFSSQMLTYLGTQKTVKSVDGNPTNTFQYATGPTTFPSAGSLSQAYLGGGVSGSYSPEEYNTTKCYFLSRGASEVYAETMTGLVIDMSLMLGVTPQSLLEKFNVGGKTMFTNEAYTAMNMLRDPGNQVTTVTTVDNALSLQARAIRS